MLTHMHPSQVRFTCRTSSQMKGSGCSSSGSGPVPEPPSAQSPFAHLGGYLRRRDVQHLVRGRYPSFIAHTDSCVGPNSSLPISDFPRRKVFAGCCQPLLEDGPSRRYLHNLCKGAWTRTPPRSLASVRFGQWALPTKDFGLAQGLRGSARETIPAMQLQQGGGFRGCSHSLMFRLLYSLGPPVAPTAVTSTGQPGRLHHAMDMWLPALNTQGFT
jgi:hypothetical protein